MIIHIGIINGQIVSEAHTSLTLLCEGLNVPYDSAARGKRVWLETVDGKNTIKEIKSLGVIKIKNRGKK